MPTANERASRLAQRLMRKVGDIGEAVQSVAPLSQMDWSMAREVIGLEASVLVEETGQVLVDWVRDVMIAQRPETKAEPRQMRTSLP